jgi:chitosanase
VLASATGGVCFVSGFNLTDRQVATIEAIVCVVESGRTDRYNVIATIPGDTGGLSYGRHQASLSSGNLFTLVNAYCAAPGSAWGDKLKPFLQRLQEKNTSLNDDPEIKKLLRAAGLDPVMVDVQDKFFYDVFMVPALNRWQSYGFNTALSAAVIYDSFIHGNFDLIAKRATATKGEPTTDNEKAWITEYLEKRYVWLTTHPNKVLHNTAIRIEALQAQVEAKNWELKLPFNLKRPSSHYPLTAYDLPGRLYKSDGKVAFQRCTPEEFGTVQLRAKSGAAPGNQRDVFIQSCLVAAGFLPPGSADGNFGEGTATAIKAFQKRCKLPQTGAIGAADFTKLCEAAETGRDLNHPEETRADSGLKPAPEGSTKMGRISGAGAATVGAGAAGAGAILIGGAVEDDAASTDAAVVAPPPAAATTTAPGAPAATTATTPAATSAATTPALVPAPSGPAYAGNPEGTLCARADVFLNLGGCKVNKVDTFTVGAVGLFIIAIGLVVIGRRVFDTGNHMSKK